MKPNYSLVLGSLLLSSFATAQVQSTELSLGTSYQGELNEQSDIHWNDGAPFQRLSVCANDSHPAGLYQLSGDIPLHVSLFDAQKQLINRLFIDSGAPSSVTLLLTPPEDACRDLVVSAQSADSQGRFELTSVTTTNDARQLSDTTPYLAQIANWNQQPVLSLEETSRVQLTMIDSTRSLNGRLAGDTQTLPLENCDSHALSLNEVMEPGSYNLQLNRVAAPVGMPEPLLYDYCEAGLVDIGDYFVITTQLSALPGGLRNGGEVQVNDQLTGILSATENRYELSLTETSRLDVRLASDAFDTVLSITGNDTDLENDDWGEGTNSALFPVLAPGDYVISVRSWSDSGTGLYDLTLSSEAYDGSISGGGPIEPGGMVEAVLTSNENLYQFDLGERSRVTISMDSDDFDAFLELSGPNTDLSDDDGGDGLNARISTILEAGEYSIVATSYSGNGTYTLSFDAEPFDSELVSQGTLFPGDLVTGHLTDSDELHYDLIVETAGEYRIDVRSDEVDAYLTLSGEGIREENDDGGEGTNACLTLSLEPGQYLLVASAYFGSTNGLLETEVTVVRGRGARGC